MRTLGIPALVLAVGARVGSRRASRQTSATTTKSSGSRSQSQILRDLTSAPDEGIPQYLLERAEGIVVHPESRQGRVRGRREARPRRRERPRSRAQHLVGAGVRQDDRRQHRLADRRAVDRSGVAGDEPPGRRRSARRTSSRSAAISPSPPGRSAAARDAATDIKVSSQILAYSRSKGLFAGASLEGSGLRADGDGQRAFYGREISLRTIVGGPDADAEVSERPRDRWIDARSRSSTRPK